MSLLIKALEKAEKGRSADGGDELSLAPLDTPASASTQKEASQQAAATVFAAKAVTANSQDSSKGLWIGGGLLLALVALGLGFYSYLNSLTKPEIVMARSPAPPAETAKAGAQASSQDAVPAEPPAKPADVIAEPSPTTSTSVGPETPAASASKEQAELVANNETTAAKAVSASQVFAGTAAPLAPEKLKQKATASKSQQLVFGEPLPTERDTGVKITRNQPANAVNPNLLAAYQAYTAGDDATAQRNYRQVLQSDVRNVDALLGMAAIAVRQGRNNDAAGWYGKVLEVEPRNNVAQAAMVNVLAQSDPVSSESRIKSLIAQQPEAAHLYASLGNLYAEQNQWPSAQQAYFQAHHFAPENAEYAFNLAVSLEQLGKSALALPYYQKALALLPANGASGVDRAQLESRIAKLQ